MDNWMRAYVLVAAICSLSAALDDAEVPADMFEEAASIFDEFPTVVYPSAESIHLKHDGDITYLVLNEQENVTRSKRNALVVSPFQDFWTNGRIPFVIGPEFDANERRIILEAMEHWENHTCIRFHERQIGELPSIYIYGYTPDVCASFVGQLKLLPFYGRLQGVSLGAGCVQFDTVIHELGHVIGLYHEHNRPDRDDYINVYPHRVPSFADQLQRLDPEDSNTLNLGYDYASIMHYRSLGGTITSKFSNIHFGDGAELSPLDVAKVNKLYHCLPCGRRPPLSTVALSISLPTNTTCGQIIKTTGTNGFFNFPGFPQHKVNQACNYVIQAPEGYKIRLDIRGVTLDSRSNCASSYISFFRGPSLSPGNLYKFGQSLKTKFCRLNGRQYFYLPANIITLSYHRNQSPAQRFRVNYYISDVNECNGYHRCHRCTNLIGSFQCICNEGYYLSALAKTCFDVNECAFENGGCHHNCNNSGGSYRCTCRRGYYLQVDGKSCGRVIPSTNPRTLSPGRLNLTSCPITFSVSSPTATTISTTKPTTLPTTAIPTTAPTDTPLASNSTCGNKTVTAVVGEDGFLKTHNWPNMAYPINTDCEWKLNCSGRSQGINIFFEDSFRVAGRMPSCMKDQVNVTSCGHSYGPFCHTTPPIPLTNLCSTDTTVTFHAGTLRGRTRTGFSIHFHCIP